VPVFREQVRVYRDGLLRVLPARELVVGDIIELEQGDAVPADVRVIRETGCRVDVSVLTGRHDLVGCSVDKTSDNPLQTENLLFFGSTVQEGSLTAVVIFTGKHTMLGRLARTMVNRRQQVCRQGRYKCGRCLTGAHGLQAWSLPLPPPDERGAQGVVQIRGGYGVLVGAVGVHLFDLDHRHQLPCH